MELTRSDFFKQPQLFKLFIYRYMHFFFFFFSEKIDFEELQAYDVADLVKQYFRELPECLLTTKLSDVFISIFICKS